MGEIPGYSTFPVRQKSPRKMIALSKCTGKNGEWAEKFHSEKFWHSTYYDHWEISRIEWNVNNETEIGFEIRFEKCAK